MTIEEHTERVAIYKLLGSVTTAADSVVPSDAGTDTVPGVTVLTEPFDVVAHFLDDYQDVLEYACL